MNVTPLEFFLCLLVGFQVKHFICDGPLQSLAMVQAKGIYGKGLGILHAALHGVGTMFVVALSSMPLKAVVILAVLDFAVHYHIDFTKEFYVRGKGWSPQDKYFWWALSADQALHQLTYIGLVWLIAKIS